jgi:hypothetical protein
MSSYSVLIEKQTSTDIIRTIKSFFGFGKFSGNKKNRIIRRYNKPFEEFIFKGYDQQTPGLFRPGSFKLIRMVCKN